MENQMTFIEQIKDSVAKLSQHDIDVYHLETDKWLWVVYNVLDPVDVPETETHVNYAERLLDARKEV